MPVAYAVVAPMLAGGMRADKCPQRRVRLRRAVPSGSRPGIHSTRTGVRRPSGGNPNREDALPGLPRAHREPPGADRIVELPGTVVLPGFVDAHVHLTGTTLSMIGIPIERARSAEELLGIVAEEVTHGPAKVLAHRS